MIKAELVAAVDAALGETTTPAESAALVEQIVDTIVRGVTAGEKVSIYGFGIFEQQHRAARDGRNPRTGELVLIAATSVPKFRPSGKFTDIVAGRVTIARTGLAQARTTTPPTAQKTGAVKKTTATKAPRQEDPSKEGRSNEGHRDESHREEDLREEGRHQGVCRVVEDGGGRNVAAG